MKDRDTAAGSEDRVAGLFVPDTCFPRSTSTACARRTEYDGERRLMIAVLEDAVDVYRKQAGARDARRQQLFRDAEEWIDSDDRAWIFSFQNICDVLDIEAEYLRRGLRAIKEQARGARKRRGRCIPTATASRKPSCRRPAAPELPAGSAGRRLCLTDGFGYSPARAGPAAHRLSAVRRAARAKARGALSVLRDADRAARAGSAQPRGAHREGRRGHRHGPGVDRVRLHGRPRPGRGRAGVRGRRGRPCSTSLARRSDGCRRCPEAACGSRPPRRLAESISRCFPCARETWRAEPGRSVAPRPPARAARSGGGVPGPGRRLPPPPDARAAPWLWPDSGAARASSGCASGPALRREAERLGARRVAAPLGAHAERSRRPDEHRPRLPAGRLPLRPLPVGASRRAGRRA